MRTMYKMLFGLIFLLLGFAIWISTSIIEAFAQLGEGSSVFARAGMSVGFLLIFLGPIIFWIVLPLKDKLYEKRKKVFIVIMIPIVIFLVILISVLTWFVTQGV